MKKYLFLSDIDGTLLRGDSGITLGVKAAAKRFKDMGGLLSLCTGRSQISTRWVAKEMAIDIPCILFSGAAIYDFSENNFLWTCPMNNDVLENVRAVYELFPDISIQVYTRDEIFAVRKNKYLEARGVKEELGDSLSEISDIKGEILKIVFAVKDAPLLKRCGEEAFSDEELHFAFASRHFAEVVSAGAGKEKALYRMAKYYNVKIEHTFAAGDGMTDLPMMKASGFSFAPVDATGSVLGICDMKIPTCEDGGMETAFNTAIEIMTKA